MLIGVFKSNRKILNGLAILVLLLLWTPAFLSDTVHPKLLSTDLRWLDLILMILLLSIQSIYLNFVVSEYKLVKDNSHLTSLIYILLNSCFIWLFKLNEVVLANTVVLLALHQLFRIYATKNAFSISFSIGFLFSLVGLIYFPMSPYFLLFWIVLIFTTTPTWRDFIVSFIGLCTPLAYFLVYKFIVGGLFLLDVNNYIRNVFVVNWENFTIYNQLFVLVLLFIICLATVNYFGVIGKAVVKTSKMLVVVLLMLAFGLMSLFLNQNDFLATFLMSSIPLTIMIASFFQNLKKVWLAEILFTLLLVTAVLGYFL